ncbi:hypothetical protein PFISCL1PPCAC_24353, partial [Pristionchus fissidentatus]
SEMCSRTRIPFTTCFGVMHVRNALLTIIILQLLGETIETLQYIFSDAPYVTDTIEFLFEIIETLTLVSTIYAWWKEKKEFVVPLFIQSILASMLTLLSTVLFFISIFFPYTAAANAFIPPAMVDETEMNRRIFFLMCFVFLTPIAALFGWFVMTAMGAYQYYDHKEKLEAFRRSRPLPSLHDPVPSDGTPKSLALVIPSAVSTEPSIEIPPTGNFANPNFSDEEEEEQELFGGRGGRSEMV